MNLNDIPIPEFLDSESFRENMEWDAEQEIAISINEEARIGGVYAPLAQRWTLWTNIDRGEFCDLLTHIVVYRQKRIESANTDKRNQKVH